MRKAESAGHRLDDDVAFFVAKHIRQNVRELEGALRRILAYAQFRNQAISLEVVKEALKDLLSFNRGQISVEFIQKTVTENPVVLFMKGTAQFPQCGFSGRAVQILKACGIRNLVTVNVLEDDEVRQAIKDFANWPTIPQLYVNGEFVGGSDIVSEMYQSGELQKLLPEPPAA